MSANHIVHLDCDGVYADFVTGVLEKMGIPFPGYDKWPWGRVFDIFPLVGSNWKEASKHCDAAFWANLPWMPDGEDILAEVEKRFRPNETMILTKPMDHDGSYTGKAEWVTTNMPDFRRRLVPTHIPKSEFAHSFNCLLIDDSQENVDKYIAAGGAAILVPRPYNQNEAVFNKGPKEVVAYVASRMDKWIDITDHPAKNRRI
jgi:5'(3')-deoxyribonucleotidase